MAGGNEYTTRFNIDITDLKNGIQQANQLIRVANSEFKAATGGMDNWGSSADGLSAKLRQLDTVLGLQKAKLEVLQAEYRRVVEAEGEGSRGAQELYIRMNNLQGEIGRTEAQIRNYSSRLEEVQREQSETADTAEDSANAYDKLKKTIAEQESALDKLKGAYAAVALEQGAGSDEAQQLAREIQELSSELDENRTSLAEAERAADEFDQTLDEVSDTAERAEGGFTVLKGALASLIADGIRAAIEGIKDFAKETIQVGMNFDSAMSEVQAISGATGDELQLLRDTAKEFGSTTVFSASEAAEALKYMALAGWDTEQSVDALGGILDLAAASGMDLATASDMVTDYLTAFGMEAKDSAYFADMLAHAQSSSNTTAEQLGEAYKNCAANLNAAGQDVETTTALLAKMADQGLKGSEAGTALSAMMRDLTAKMKDGAVAIGETQVQVMDANGNYRDLTDILQDVENATQGMGDAERAAALSSTFTSDSIKGLNLILNAGVGEAASFEEGLRNAAGTAKEMADTMNDNLGGDLKALGSQLEGIQIALYEKLEPALRKGVEILSSLLSVLDFVIEHSAEFVAAIGAMGAGIAAYVAYTTAIKIMEGGFLSLSIAQKAVTAAQWLMNAAMTANPIGLIIAAIAALVAAFVLLAGKSEEFREFWSGLWEGIKAAVAGVVDAIVLFFTETIPNAWRGFLTFCGEFITGIVEFFSQLPEKIAAAVAGVTVAIISWGADLIARGKEIASGFLNTVVSFFSELPGKILEFISNALNHVKAWASDMAGKAKETGTNFLKQIVEFFKQIPVKVKEYITAAFENVKTWVSNMISKAKELGKDFVEGISGFFSQLPGKIQGFITTAFQHVVTWASNMANKAKEAGSNFLTNVTSFFSQLPGKVADFLSQVISRLTSWATEMGRKGLEGAKAFFDAVIDKLKELPGDVLSIGEDIVHGLWEGISGAAGWLARKVKGFASDIIDGMERALRIGSPSKVARDRIGKWIPEGVAVGIRENTKKAVNASRNMAKQLMPAAETLKYDIKNSVPQFEAGAANTGVNTGNTTIFNQYNSSPKALSRLEIYRQTRNQLAFARGN